MSKFNKGDIVICVKFTVEQRILVDNAAIRIEPYVDDTWFNRRAFISEVSVSEVETLYEITFLDKGTSLAWVREKDLILFLPLDDSSSFVLNDSKWLL